MDKTYCNEKEIQSSCLSIINNAQACQCIEDGSRGERDSLIEINIWSRPEFNDLYDIKDNIKSLFNITLYDTKEDSTCSRFVDFGQLDDFNGFKRDTAKFYGFQKKNCIILRLNERPKLINQDYLFWFEFKYKSGRKQLLRSQRIKWIERIK